MTNRTIDVLRRNRQPLARKCTMDGVRCSRAIDDVCNPYAFPEAKWRNGDCPMADAGLKADQPKAKAGKVRVGQQKQKRLRR